jgi:hypothetical protein
MSKQIKTNPDRVTFDPRHLDVEALDEIADERGMSSRAELIRQTLSELVEREADDEHADAELDKPENEELRDAFETLLDLSDHPRGPRTVGVQEAKDRLNHQSCPKDAVKRRLLEPLNDDGYITVRNARITVHRRTVKQVEAAEAQADAALERVAEANHPEMRPGSKRLEPEHQELQKYQRAGLNPPIEYIGWVGARTLWEDNEGASV